MPRNAISSNPAETRRDIQTAYDRYMNGVDRFPKIKIFDSALVEELPRKTQPVATALVRAWERIDCDEAWWEEAVAIMGLKTRDMLNRGAFTAPISAMTRVGRNVVRVGIISPPKEEGYPASAFFKAYTTSEFAERFDGVELNVGRDSRLRIERGKLILGDSVPDMAVVRDSNVALLFGLRPDDNGFEEAGVPREPVYPSGSDSAVKTLH